MIDCAGFKPAMISSIETAGNEDRAALIFEKGNALYKEKDFQGAFNEFKIIVDKYKKTTAYEPSLYLLAFCYHRLGNFEKSAGLGEKFLNEFPNSNYYLNIVSLIGESYFKLAQDYKAAHYLLKYYTQTNDSTGRRKSLERITTILPSLKSADLAQLHRLYMADPIDEHILYCLAAAEAEEGKKAEAERDFNLLIRKFPNTQYAQQSGEYQKILNLGKSTSRAGILLPLSGRFANIGEQLLQVVEIFQKNYLLPFSVHYFDTKSDPIDAALAAIRLIDDLRVDFLIAPISVSSGEAFSVCGLAYGKGVPLILPMTQEGKFESIPFVFTGGRNNEDQARIVARYAMQNLGVQRFAILYPDQARYKSVADAFAREVLQNNREISTMVSFPADSITLKWEMKKIEEKNPQAIFLPMDTEMIINCAPQIAYYHLEKVQLLGIHTFHDEKITRLGEKYVENAVFAAPASIDSTALKEFIRYGLKEDDMIAKFFYTLWKLRDLRTYTRSNLAKTIEDILKSNEIFGIYVIRNNEFQKIYEMTK